MTCLTKSLHIIYFTVGAADECSIVVKDFKKVYPGGKYAVRGMSLGIPTGECFGLLGNLTLRVHGNTIFDAIDTYNN